MLGHIIHDPATREEWLGYRAEGIGASEAGTVLGVNPYSNARALWEIKTGRAKRPDLSGNPAVQFGIAAEEHIRALWALQHPDWKVVHNPYRMYGRGCMYATLDGELTDPDGHRGIIEIKTATPHVWSEWDGRIPQGYYVQLLHQLYCCPRAEFAILVGYLMGGDRVSIREYKFYRDVYREDIQSVAEIVTRFWGAYVMPGVEPPDTLPEI